MADLESFTDDSSTFGSKWCCSIHKNMGMRTEDAKLKAQTMAYQSHAADGEILMAKKHFERAVESLSRAIEIRPNAVDALVNRAKCFIELGEPGRALKDADACLAEDKDFYKGLFMKAEALYCAGDFEYALVFYHRGCKREGVEKEVVGVKREGVQVQLRPELDMFRLGIQKAREAIDNSIGGTGEITGRLQSKPRRRGGGVSTVAESTREEGTEAGGEGLRNARVPRLDMSVARTSTSRRPKTDREIRHGRKLLGALYDDIEYLEQLRMDPSINNEETEIDHLIDGGLKDAQYLEQRQEFWRQQQPLFLKKSAKKSPRTSFRSTGRKSGHSTSRSAKSTPYGHSSPVSRRLEKMTPASSSKEGAPRPLRKKMKKKRKKRSKPPDTSIQVGVSAEGVRASLAEVHDALEAGDPTLGLKFAKNFLQRLEEVGDLPDKDRVVVDVELAMGKTERGLGHVEEAVHHHRKALEVVRNASLNDLLGPVLDALAQMLVFAKQHEQAVEAWKEKLQIDKGRGERARTMRNMAKSLVELMELDAAKENMEEALQLARAERDKTCIMLMLWTMVHVLEARGEGGLSVPFLEEYAEMAHGMKNKSAWKRAKEKLALLEGR